MGWLSICSCGKFPFVPWILRGSLIASIVVVISFRYGYPKKINFVLQLIMAVLEYPVCCLLPRVFYMVCVVKRGSLKQTFSRKGQMGKFLVSTRMQMRLLCPGRGHSRARLPHLPHSSNYSLARVTRFYEKSSLYALFGEVGSYITSQVRSMDGGQKAERA